MLTATGVAAAVSAAVVLLWPVAPRPTRRRSGSVRALGLVAVALVVSVGVQVLDAQGLVLAVIGVGTAGGIGSAFARSRRRRVARDRADRTLAFCEYLATDLRAGRPPALALAEAAGRWPELAPAAAAADLSADVPGTLRELSRLPGAAALRTVAAAWQVAHECGAGLATTMERTVVALDRERTTGRIVEVEAASARSTGVLLAVLPLAVNLLGRGIGGDPVAFLVGSAPGLVCLAVGVALLVTGQWWLDRIVEGVLG